MGNIKKTIYTNKQDKIYLFCYQETGEPGATEKAAAGKHPSLRPDTALHPGGGQLVAVAALDLGRILAKHLVRVHHSHGHGNFGLHYESLALVWGE